MNKVFYLLLIVALCQGCCGSNQIRVFDRTVEKRNILTSASSKINSSAKTIQKGMSKDQVLEAWGNPDWYGPGENSNIWFYSNVKKLKVNEPVTYQIIFADNVISKIQESVWSKKQWMCRTFDL